MIVSHQFWYSNVDWLFLLQFFYQKRRSAGLDEISIHARDLSFVHMTPKKKNSFSKAALWFVKHLPKEKEGEKRK